MPAQAREPIPPRPTGDPGNWITPKDYPTSELARGADGMTAFTISVGEDGNPIECSITGSSGSAALDATACALAKARARFDPARDIDGRKVVGYYSTRVRWVVPADSPLELPEKTDVTTTIAMDDRGVVQGCTFSGFNAQTPAASAATSPCTRYPKGLKMRPYLDAFGTPLAVRVNIRNMVEVTPDPGGRGLHP